MHHFLNHTYPVPNGDMKILYIAVIVIFVIASWGPGVAYGELAPKTLAQLYQEYQGKLIIRGQIMSVSENTVKNLTSYDIKILEYITRPQQASLLTAQFPTENKTYPVFGVGENAQVYLERGSSGYVLSPYSFTFDKKCYGLGPNYAGSLENRMAPAPNFRFLDPSGNTMIPSLNQEFTLASDVGVYTPRDKLDSQISVNLNNDPTPIFDKRNLFSIIPCSGSTIPTWKFTPTETGNYTIHYKVIGGTYQDKIILDNATFTTAFTVEKSTNIVSTKNITNSFIGNDLIPIISSPLQQFKSETKTEDVKCREGFQLVIKSVDGSPACVRPDTAKILVKRGWGSVLVDSTYNQKMNGTISGMVSAYVYGGPVLSSPNHSVHYEVDVYATDGVTLVGKTISDYDAHYLIELPVGNYTIYTYSDGKQEGHLISVYPNKNTVFDISSSMSVP